MARRFETLFPTRILTGSLGGAKAMNRALMKDIFDFSKKDQMGKRWSEENYRGGYTSYASLSDLHHRAPSFMALAAALETEAKAFARGQGWKVRLEMTACWMNIMPCHTYHTLHLHPHSVISGAYYVDTPNDSVSLKIEDPRMMFYMNAPLRENEGLYFEVKPKAGNFVLFESWLRHEVPPNRSKKPRVGISFNFGVV